VKKWSIGGFGGLYLALKVERVKFLSRIDFQKYSKTRKIAFAEIEN